MAHYNNKIAAWNYGGSIFVERDGKIELAGFQKPMEHYDTMFAGNSGGPIYVFKEGKTVFAGIISLEPYAEQRKILQEFMKRTTTILRAEYGRGL